MTSPRVTSDLMQRLEATAHDGVFWRRSTHDTAMVLSVNVAVCFNTMEEFWRDGALTRLMKCSGYIVDPALPEMRMTPKHTEHQITGQMVDLWLPTRFRHLLEVIEQAISKQHVTCLIAVKVQWTDDTIEVFFHDSCSGIAVWDPIFHREMIRCAEMFCGGYAGWDYAVSHLRAMGMNVQTVIAVDTCSAATVMYAMNHQGLIIDTNEDPREMLYDADNMVCVAPFPVQLPTWYHMLFELNVQCWCVSPPCPPFSKATDMQGFLRDDGKITLEAICSIRLNQPCLICLENVPGMAEGMNHKTMKAMFKWAGYDLVHSECNDLGDVAPTSRKRWLSVWIRKDLAIEIKPTKATWLKARDFSLRDFGILELSISPGILQAFMLPDESRKLYGDAAFLPQSMSKGRVVSDEIAGCLARCVVGTSKYNTFVATYGSQHQIPEKNLAEKGLFAQVVACGDDTFRFITPFEQIVTYATRLPMRILLDTKEAYKAIGNAISPAQALYCLVKAFQAAQIPDAPTMDAMLVVIQFISQRPKPAEIKITKTLEWYIMHLDDTWNHPAKDSIMMHPKGVSEHPECQTDDKGDTHDDDIETDTIYANVTIVLPMDAVVGRYAIPITPREILSGRGYDPSFMHIRNIDGQVDLMDQVIVKDATMIVFTDCETHIEQAAMNFRQIFGYHFGSNQHAPKLTIVVKHRNTVFWQGIAPVDTQLEVLHAAVTKELKRTGIQTNLRWTCRGTPLNHTWGWKFSDLTHAGTVKLRFHFPTSGGAPQDKKLDETLKTRLTAALVANGVSFSHIVPSVTLIANRCTAEQIHEAIAAKEGDPRNKAVQKLLSIAEYTAENKRAAKRSHAATQIQKAVRAKKQDRKEIDVTTLSVDNDMFANEDDTPADVKTGPFEPNGSGVFLTTTGSALSWLQASKTISADELAILLVGHADIPTHLPKKQIQFRARQENGSILLLKGTLYQLGTKHVKTIEGPVTTIPCPDTAAVTFTAYADEFAPETWKGLTNSPGRTMLDFFDADTRKQSVLSLWGHSFHRNGKPAKPHECDSVQFHARVLASAPPALLGQSGWNSIYMAPKHDSKDKRTMPDQKFSVIWAGTGKKETMLTAKTIQATLGLVRNRNSVGIGAAHDTFIDSWQKVHPSREAPPSIQVQKVFRAQNLPCNITLVEIRKWLASIKWSAKPLKKVAFNAWLIGADCDPEATTFVLNENVILLTPQQRRQEVETPVLAGRPAFAAKKQEGEKSVDFPLGDPWASYVPRNSSKFTANTHAPAPQAGRQVDGPVNTRFAEQDAKIDSLSRKFDELQSLQTKIHKDNETIKHEVENHTKQQAAKLVELSKSVDARLTQQADENNARFGTLQNAVEAGRTAEDEQFAILREMLMQNVASANGNDPRKTARTDGKLTPGGTGTGPFEGNGTN
eukprot:Skav217261  [mRNA]  locus=scaffold47:1251302:1255693:+ [translate_table: standard]